MKTLLDAMDDPALFGPWFASASWGAWRAFLAMVFGLPMSEDQAACYRAHTGRETRRDRPAREVWALIGRRGGKSLVAAVVAVWLACFRDYASYLAPGERATVMLIAADRRQARVVFRYIAGLLDGVPALAALIERRTQEAIALTTRVVLEVHTASYRTLRGYSVAAAIYDEIAFWPTDESANPDVEILNAIRPAMATIPGALLLAISSPYARRGALWEAYRGHYGRDGDPILVWQGETLGMNPTIDPEIVAVAYARDEAVAAAEYGAQFRRDIESFVAREAIEACIVPGRHECAPVEGGWYAGFVDPSGGAQDSMTLAIAHHEADGRLVLDCVRERRPPFSPEDVVREFAEVLQLYGLSWVTGDRYGGEWPRERLQAHGITYEVADRPKSDLYRELLPLVNSGRVELLDHPRLLAQLGGLQRRTARGGRDSIDHGPNAHDDLVNAAAGALVGVGRRAPGDYGLTI